MTCNIRQSDRYDGGEFFSAASVPVITATILREDGYTGVQTHVRQFRAYLRERGDADTLLTSFSWMRAVTVPLFGFRLALARFSTSASVAWYRRWHEVTLYRALRNRLAEQGDCIIYAQCPLAAQAALRARTGPNQSVIMAVHFRISQADEWADKRQIRRGGHTFATIRRLEREVIAQVDGLIYVSSWAQRALTGWLPIAAEVPAAVIDNFVADTPRKAACEETADLVTIGHLEPVKNHGYLLEVLAAANRSGRTLTLDVFGDGPLRESLAQQTRVLGLNGQIRFRGYRPDVRDLLPGYKAYVHVSYSESSSLAIIEAMAAGLPIVAGVTGPIPELCDDGVEARYWSLSDPTAAAATVVELLECEPERLKTATAARDRFDRDFNAAVIAPRLWTFLQQAASAARRSHE
jgi:glycosyltransferase involved in cell wall biosynthesis